MKRTLLIAAATLLTTLSVHTTKCNPGELLGAIKHDLHSPEYVQEVLGGSFEHLLELLDYGKQTEQSRPYFRSVIKLFTNLLKGTQWVNAYAFADMLDHVPHLLKEQFILYKTNIVLRNKGLLEADMFDRFNATVNTMLYTKFNEEYNQFRSNPGAFLDTLSYQIIEVMQEEVTVEQLRQSLIRFLELAIGKLVWNPEDEAKTWQSVKSIAAQIADLMEYNIIDDINDIDDLFWSLIHRYCFFLNITAVEMPVSFYEEIQNDLAMQQPLLLALEEQEDFIESKAECVLRNLIQSKAKRSAFDRGILM